MMSWSKEPRRMHASKISLELHRLRASVWSHDKTQSGKVDAVKSNPVEFFHDILGFERMEYQTELIDLF
jgi:hypothetical protein